MLSTWERVIIKKERDRERERDRQGEREREKEKYKDAHDEKRMVKNQLMKC